MDNSQEIVDEIKSNKLTYQNNVQPNDSKNIYNNMNIKLESLDNENDSVQYCEKTNINMENIRFHYIKVEDGDTNYEKEMNVIDRDKVCRDVFNVRKTEESEINGDEPVNGFSFVSPECIDNQNKLNKEIASAKAEILDYVDTDPLNISDLNKSQGKTLKKCTQTRI